MSSTPRTLKRLGVATVGVCTLLSTPYLGVATALAVTPSVPATVDITSQTSGYGSTKNDGFDSAVKISANVTVPGTGQQAVSGVRFSYTPVDGAFTVTGPTVQLGIDNTAPYSVTYSPVDTPAATFYRETAEALDTNGNVISASQAFQDAIVKAANSSVHIASPIEGANLGVSSTGNIIVSGTRSVDLPALDVVAAYRDNSDGTVGSYGSPTSVDPGIVTTPANPNTWAAVVALPAGGCPNAAASGCNLVINASIAGATGSDETTEAVAYDAVLNTFTVAPADATTGVGVPQDFVVTAKDQNGAAIGGVVVTATENPGTAADESSTPVPTNGGTLASAGTGGASGTTGTDGKFTFRSVDATVGGEVTNFKIVSGAGNPATDFTIAAKLTTYVSSPKTPTLSLTPTKSLYATDGGGGGEYTASTPVTDVCITDQSGNPYSNTNTAPSNLIVKATRVIKTGATTTTPPQPTPGLTADAATGKSNCYKLSHNAAGAEDSGSETFNAYFENNGTPGFQAGSTDVGATPVTANYAKLTVNGLNTQAVKGTNVTVAFKVSTPDGTTPFVGRKLNAFLNSPSGNANFPTTQPATTVRTNAFSASCTTDATGVCAVTVTDTTAEDATIDLVDLYNDAASNQVATGNGDAAVVSFRTKSVALTELGQSGSVDILQPAGSNTDSSNLRPGDVAEYEYRLIDANNKPLANVSTTLTTDNGFFTPACNGVYEKCTFNTAPATAAVTGLLKSSGKSIPVTSDDYGYITFALADGADAGLNDDGKVQPVLTATANGGTAKTSDATSDSLEPFTTNNIEVANGGTVTLLPATAADKLSGDVQDNGSNLIPGQTGFSSNTGTNFLVHVTDQFGNLVRLFSCDVDITVTGGGYLHDNANPPNHFPSRPACGSFTGNPAQEVFQLDSDSVSTTGQSNTVTAKWDAPVTVFKAITPTPTNPPLFDTADGTPATVTKTASFTINLYAVDEKALKYAFASTPGNSVPANTAVTTSVTVSDQKNNPVQGLCTHFLRSGPGAQSGEGGASDFFGNCTLQTNSAGKAGYSYSSTAVGTATVTVIVSDASGNELSRGVQNVTFTSGTPSTTGTVTINGQTSQFVKYGTRMVVTGQAPANSSVTVYFHRAYVAGLTPKTATANANGVWSVVYSAVDDFSYYAQVGSARAATVLTRIDPNVSGADRTARKGQMVTVSGKSGARSAVNVHVGSAVHAVRAGANGVWTYTFKFAGTVAIFANRTEHNVHTAGITIRG